MSSTTTISNIFFAFWYVLGEYFLYIIGSALVFIIIYELYYFLFKR